MRDFRNLQVWEKGHSLTLNVYKATASFPKDELYGLISQIRRPVHLFQPILLRGAAGMEMQNSLAL